MKYLENLSNFKANKYTKDIYSLKYPNAQLLLLIFIIVSSLFVAGLIYKFYLTTKNNDINNQATNIVRLLASMNREQLLGKDGRRSMLQALYLWHKNTHFAYGVLTDSNRETVLEVKDPELEIPVNLNLGAAHNGIKQQHMNLPVTNDEIIEFNMPWFEDGNKVGFIRIGYFTYQQYFMNEYSPLIAKILLPMFITYLLFYLFLYLDSKKVIGITYQIRRFVSKKKLGQIQGGSIGDIAYLIDTINNYTNMVGDKIKKEHDEKFNLEVNNSVNRHQSMMIASILNSMPEAIIVMDQSGECLLINTKCREIIRPKDDDVVGKNIRDITEDNDLIKIIENVDLTGNYIHYNQCYIYKSKEGDEKYQIKLYPITIKSNQNKGYIFYFTNIEIEKKSKDEHKDNELIANLSHELKSPLNVISIYSETLLENKDDDPENRIKSINIIHDEANKLGKMIKALLILNEIEQGEYDIKMRSVNLKNLITDCYKRALLDSDIEGDIESPVNLSRILGDKNLLEIAIDNVLSNAVKYCTNNARIDIKIEEDDSYISIAIQDNGIGIPISEIQLVTGKFYRGSNARQQHILGHGLGLSLVNLITDIHHGILDIESAASTGTKITIKLLKTDKITND